MKKKRSLPLIALCLMLFLGLEAMAQSAIERLKTDYPAVMEHYAKRLEAQKADYVIAIDVSGSMLNHKSIVEPALSSFIDALPEGDYLSIIKFGAKAEEFGLSGKVDKSTRDGFKQSLIRIYERDEAFVRSTNIFTMCEAVLAQMSRPGGNDLKYIFMFTDFIDLSGKQESEYQKLGERVAAMAKMNTIRAFAMQLPGGNGEGRDIPKVRCVFPNLQTIDVENSTQLNSWFEGQKAEISKVRLKDLIRGDFDKWYSENKITAELSIDFNRGLNLKYNVDNELVPAFVNGVVVQSCEPINKSNNIEKVVISMDTTFYKGRNISEKIGHLEFFNSALFQKDTKVTMATTYRPLFTMAEKEGEPSFANEIRNLELEEDLTRTVELSAENDFVLGWNIWLASALLLLLLVFLYYFVKMTVLPYKLKNMAVVVTTTCDKNTYSHIFNNEASALFGTRGVVLPQANFVLEVRGKRGFPIFVPRSIVFEITQKPQNAQLYMHKNRENVSALVTTVKTDDDVRIQQGMTSYNFKLRNR